MFEMSFGRRIALLVVLVLFCGLIALVTTARIARAQPTGSVDGTVTGSDTHLPIGGCSVEVYDLGDVQVGSNITNPAGYYLVSGLAAGTYRVKYIPPAGHVNEWYSNKVTFDAADNVPVSAGGTTTANAELDPYSSISGKITSEVTGAPVYPCNVKLFLVSWDAHTEKRDEVAAVTTNAQGQYSFNEVAPGPYKIEYIDQNFVHYDQWFGGTRIADDGQEIYLPEPGTITGVDQVLLAGCAFKGRVTNNRGEPIGSATIQPYLWNQESGGWAQVPPSNTDAGGNYIAGPYDPGEYKFQVYSTDSIFVEWWYNNKGADNFDRVQDAKGETKIINPVVIGSGSVSGKITRKDVHGYPIFDCQIQAYSGGSGELKAVGKAAASEQDGSYRIDGLPPGSYKLKVTPPGSLWVTGWFREASDSTTADIFYVYESRMTNDVNVRLAWAEHARYAVTVASDDFSHYGTILTSLGIDYEELKPEDTGDYCMMAEFDAVFVDCCPKISHDYDKWGGPNSELVRYVQAGGEVFLNDLSGSKILTTDFAGKVNFTAPADDGSKQEVTASIVDAGLAQYLGRSSQGLVYDQGGWGSSLTVAAGVTKYMQGSNIQTENNNKKNNVPMVISFTHGTGKVHFCNFHEDVQGDFGAELLGYFVGGGPGPTPGSNTYCYLAEGCTADGMETWVLVQNPNSTNADVNITYMTPAGAVTGPAATIPPHSRQSFDVSQTVPNEYQVSTKVTSKNTIYGERSMFGNSRSWATDSIGVANPSKTWYLAEGSTAGGMETWVLVQNPNDKPANVVLTYMTATGPVEGPAVSIPANSRVTFQAAATVPEQWDVSTKITSDEPVIAERSMYGNGRAWATDSVGVTSGAKSWYLAEGSTAGGMETWVLVQNPLNAPVNVNLLYMTTAGAVPGQAATIPANSRVTFKVADVVPDAWEVSTLVTAEQNVIAERSMYGNDRQWATDSIGVSAPAKSWFLPEGSTGGGMETWILVQNPNNDPAHVKITYMTEAGLVVGPEVDIPANSRMSFEAAKTCPETYQVSTEVESTSNVIAERSMYGNGRTWATDSIGYR